MGTRLSGGRVRGVGSVSVFWVENFTVCSGALAGVLLKQGGLIYRVCADDGRKLELYEEDTFFNDETARRVALAELFET